MQGPIIGNPENIQCMVAATTVLHNYLCINNDPTYLPAGAADTIYGGGEGGHGRWRAGPALPQAPGTPARNHTMDAANARLAFTEYFVNEGAVEWQFDYVNRRLNR